MLLVGTPTSLQSYDVEENKDLFFRDVPDGVNTAIMGRLGTIEAPMSIVGGNCSIQVVWAMKNRGLNAWLKVF